MVSWGTFQGSAKWVKAIQQFHHLSFRPIHSSPEFWSLSWPCFHLNISLLVLVMFCWYCSRPSYPVKVSYLNPQQVEYLKPSYLDLDCITLIICLVSICWKNTENKWYYIETLKNWDWIIAPLQQETQPTLHVKCHLKTLSIPTILLWNLLVLNCLTMTRNYLTFIGPLSCINLQWNIALLLVPVNVLQKSCPAC